jgi:hypothetical protein
MNKNLTVHEHAVRKLRRLRCAGVATADLRDQALAMQRTLFIDADRALEECQRLGSIEGYPYLVAAELKAQKAAE